MKVDETLLRKLKKSVKLQRELDDLKEEISRLKDLCQKYPDLEMSIDRWKRERYSSKEVNTIADKCDFHHSCGCCPDAPLYASPYLELDGIKIYSRPTHIEIGQRDAYYNSASKGDRAHYDWEEVLKSHDISECVIEKAREYLQRYADLDEED